MAEHLETGKKAEDLATEILEQKGYQILVRNYRSGKAEIDIIVQKNDWLIFVEVKSLSSNRYGYPEQSVSKAKQNHVKYAAQSYIQFKNWKGKVRFDVIAITFSKVPDIQHFEDAFW
jgi:putative endonuclease